MIMPRGSKMASKKKRATESIHDRDRIIARLPDGLRDNLAALAQANGRSMTAEITEAIEKHVTGADRVSQLWEFIQRYRRQIELMPVALAAIENLEIYAAADGERKFRGGLTAWREYKKHEQEAREAAQPLITDEQAEVIRLFLTETGIDEARFLAEMKASGIEDIRDFERAIAKIGAQLQKEHPPA
jgi:predicted DNA-binding protein